MRVVPAILLTAVAVLIVRMDDSVAQDRARDGTIIAAPVRQDGALRRRPRVRIYREDDVPNVYPRYNPGPNAVRDCTAFYVQEFRPSGTVITPRMRCFWRQP